MDRTLFFGSVLMMAAVCFGDRLDNTYLPPSSAKTAGGSGSFLAAPSFSNPQKLTTFGGQRTGSFSSAGFGGRSHGGGGGSQAFHHGSQPSFGGQYQQQQAQAYNHQPAFRHPNADIPILRYSNDNHGDGNYAFSYETGNSIKAEEHGHARGDGTVAEGGYSYTAPDGQIISVTYTADENGFHPVGAHLPTPPPIPEAILKSIEQNRREASTNNGAYDDGSYKGEYAAPSVQAARSQHFDHNGYHY